MSVDVDTYARAWIFLSIGDAGGCSGPVSQASLMSAADANNHSIPTADELATVLAGLAQDGLVAVSGQDSALTDSGCQRYRSAIERFGRFGNIERLSKLAEEWASPD